MEIEDLIEAGRANLEQVQRIGLEWKGRALGAQPALKVALAALIDVQWVGRGVDRECPWCGSTAWVHKDGCARQVAIKVIKEALGVR